MVGKERVVEIRYEEKEKTERWRDRRKKADVGWWCSLSVCMWERKRGSKEVVFPLQQSVGLAFTVAEQSGRHSRPAGSTWHAISSAPGTLAAQPAQPKHTSISDQNNAKQTHTKHTDNMWGWGLGGVKGGDTDTAEQWWTVSAARASSCSAISDRGGRSTKLYCWNFASI